MSSIIDEINHAMPPGAVLDVTLETVQNLATALLRAKAHIIETKELYLSAMRYASEIDTHRIRYPELSVEYQEIKDAIQSSSGFGNYSGEEYKKKHYERLLDLQVKYFEGRMFRARMAKVRGDCND